MKIFGSVDRTQTLDRDKEDSARELKRWTYEAEKMKMQFIKERERVESIVSDARTKYQVELESLIAKKTALESEVSALENRKREAMKPVQDLIAAQREILSEVDATRKKAQTALTDALSKDAEATKRLADAQDALKRQNIIVGECEGQRKLTSTTLQDAREKAAAVSAKEAKLSEEYAGFLEQREEHNQHIKEQQAEIDIQKAWITRQRNELQKEALRLATMKRMVR